jgi:serine/alanine adding enzyme
MSGFTIIDSIDRCQWGRFVEEHPKGSVFHTPQMHSVFSQTKNHYPFALAAIDRSGDILALLVSVRVQTLPDPLGSLSSRSIFYAEPLCREDDDGVAALAAIVEEHDRYMRSKVLFSEVRPLYAAGAEGEALAKCDYQLEGYLNYVTDLRRSPNELWQQMSKSCRANIRRGSKRGLTVEELTDARGIDVLYEFLKTTYERAKVPLADKSLFSAAFSTLHPENMIKIFAARYEGEIVATDAILTYKKMLYAWYGGSRRISAFSPFECLTWHEIEWGKQNGYELYDFGGAGWPHEPYGVREFKAKFGGDLVNFGRYRKVYFPWKFTLADRAYKVAKGLISPRSEPTSRAKSEVGLQR